MKMSFSVSDDVGMALKDRAKSVSDGNESLLADLALKRLLDIPEDELRRAVAYLKWDRMAATRDGWNRAYWFVLGEELGRVDSIDNPFAPRSYGDFIALLLMNHANRPDDEDDPFAPYIAPRMAKPESPPAQQWLFDRKDSPVQAAKTVAARLRELGVTLRSA